MKIIYIKKELKEASGSRKLKSKVSELLNCTYLKGIFGFSFWTKNHLKTGSDHNALKFILR